MPSAADRVMAMDHFIWLHHPETDGYFRCPPDAVEAWTARGWEFAEGPPPEPDKTRDEPMLAALQEALVAEQAPAQSAEVLADESTEETRTTRTSRRTAAATDEKE
jgi:hypothetical protein